MPDRLHTTEPDREPDAIRRGLLLSGSIAAGMFLTGAASAQSTTDTAPRVLNGEPVPEPPADKSAGPTGPAVARC